MLGNLLSLDADTKMWIWSLVVVIFGMLVVVGFYCIEGKRKKQECLDKEVEENNQSLKYHREKTKELDAQLRYSEEYRTYLALVDDAEWDKKTEPCLELKDNPYISLHYDRYMNVWAPRSIEEKIRTVRAYYESHLKQATEEFNIYDGRLEHNDHVDFMTTQAWLETKERKDKYAKAYSEFQGDVANMNNHDAEERKKFIEAIDQIAWLWISDEVIQNMTKATSALKDFGGW